MQTTELKQQASNHGHTDCIWMQAGVVRKKICKLDYRCQSCQFDMVLQRIVNDNHSKIKKGLKPQGNRGKIVAWQEKLNTLPPGRRPCIHHMKKRIGFRACTHEYRCSDCDFDQYFQDEFTVHAVVKPVSVLDVDGFKMPQGYYLHHGHAWVKIEEVPESQWGIGGNAVTAAMLHQMQQGNAA